MEIRRKLESKNRVQHVSNLPHGLQIVMKGCIANLDAC